MVETTVSVNLREGIKSKTFAAEVTGDLGEPLNGIEVRFSVDGEASLDAERVVSLISAQTDGLGRASVCLSRPDGRQGELGATLHAECPGQVASLAVRFLEMTPERQAAKV